MSTKDTSHDGTGQGKGTEHRRSTTSGVRGRIPAVEEMHPLMPEIISKQATINIGRYYSNLVIICPSISIRLSILHHREWKTSPKLPGESDFLSLLQSFKSLLYIMNFNHRLMVSP